MFDLHTLRRLASTISQTTWGAMPLGMSAGRFLGVLHRIRTSWDATPTRVLL
jgi:hypothetical protein